MSVHRELEISTAPWVAPWSSPKEAFQVIGPINETRPENRQIGIELYPGVRWPFVVTQEKIDEWRALYGNVPIVRVHLPFHNDMRSALRNWRRMKMNVTERAGIGPLLLYAMGTVSNMKALEIAQTEGAEVNAHVSVIEQAEKAGNLEAIKLYADGVYVENEGSYSSSDPKEIAKSRSPIRSIMAVKNNGLQGVIYGADHAQMYKIDPVSELMEFPQEYRDMIRSVHIAGPGHHGRIDGTDTDFRRLLRYKRQNLGDDVSFCVDMSPFVLLYGLSKMDVGQQREYFQGVINAFEQ